jgi:hypothetical protein
MTKSHKITLIFAIIFLILDITIIDYYFHCRVNDKTELENAIYNETNCSTRLANLRDNLINTYESEGHLIDQNTRLINIKGDTIPLLNVLKINKCYLIFRYSFTSCSNCISEVTQLLYANRESLKNIEVLLLPYYQSYRDLIVQNSTSFNKAFALFMPINNQIGLPIDNKDLPYLFFINDGKIAKHIIIADPSELDLLKGYLKTISIKYGSMKIN